MADIWAAVVLTTGTALFAGRKRWHRHHRRQRHARIAALRLQRQAVADLSHLECRNRLLQDRVGPSPHAGSKEGSDSMFGPDLIGDFHRIVITELQIWADEAAEELGRLRGRRLDERRAALRKLRAEIRLLCTEIEDREAMWTKVPDRMPAESMGTSAGHPPSGPEGSTKSGDAPRSRSLR